MPTKRGRPISSDNTDPITARRRELTAARVRRWREHHRQLTATATPPTSIQQEQGENIIEQNFTDNTAPPTLAQLGLRIQNLTIAQDVSEEDRQNGALPTDEHESLYRRQSATSLSITPLPPIARSTTVTEIFHTFANRSQAQSLPLLPTHPPRTISSSVPAPPPPLLGTAPIDDASNDTDNDYIFFTQPENLDDNEIVFNETSSDDISIRTGEKNTIPPEGNVTENEESETDQTTSSDLDKVGTEDNNSSDGTPSLGSIHATDSIDEEGSFYGFSSERSEAGSESIEDKVTPRQFTVDKLYEHLQSGFHGCSGDQHDEASRQHHESVRNHYGLDEIFRDDTMTFPSVLPLPTLLSAGQLAQQGPHNAELWQTMFCGITVDGPASTPHHICLHREETQAVEPVLSFDIDSFLGFASSLSVAKQGIRYQPAPQMKQNITTDVHLQSQVYHENEDPEQPTRASLAMLKDIPHFFFGRVEGAHDISIHILFPHLVQTSSNFTCLTQEQYTRWFDRIFNPAVHTHLTADYTQHLPSSFRHAYANSKARQVETRMIETASYQSQQSISYFLNPESLDDIWTQILRTINDTPGLRDFREPQLFFSAKGTKLQFKTNLAQPTLRDAMENFETYIERIMDFEFIYHDRFYVDLGKEICSSLGLINGQTAHFGDEAQVYLWKRCCLRQNLSELYDGQPPKCHGPGQRFYEQNMLYDAAGLTSLTPKRSRLREGGLIYSQYYSSVKEIVDAAKCYPFANDGLEELALDPQIRRGARSIVGGNRRNAKALENAYCATKHRVGPALYDSRRKSYGIREEHRVSWPLYQGLLGRLRQRPPEELEILLSDCPSYAWPVKTSVYLDFLTRSANKFATGFEVVLARCGGLVVTWEQTKMMAMFLRCLRFVFGGHQLSRESALWWSRRDLPDGDRDDGRRRWYGLGFCNTLPRYGYCWIEPRIDWARMEFHRDLTDDVLFGNHMLRDQYLRHGGVVADFFGTTRQLDLALDWLEKYRENRTIRDRLLFWLAFICLKQFRVDTLSNVAGEIATVRLEDALRGDQPFSYDYFLHIMASESIHLVSGNRLDFKDPRDFGRYLFQFDDGRTREHWADLPFRKIFQRTVTALQQSPHIAPLAGSYVRRLLRCLFMYHWILPYPGPSGLTQVTKATGGKRGVRMWYSIQHLQDHPTPRDRNDERQWVWAKDSWRSGHPPALSVYLGWTRTEWGNWIERQQREVST